MIANINFKYLLICLAILSLFANQLAAEEFPFSFTNNQVKLLVSRSSSDQSSAVKVEVRAPQSSSYRLFHAENPTRIVIDFRDARITRSRTFTIQDESIVKRIRCGVHPNHLRVVVELGTKELPKYSLKEVGDWYTLTVEEFKSQSDSIIHDGSASAAAELNLDDLDFQGEVWNKTAFDTKTRDYEQTQVNHLDFRPKVDFRPNDKVRAVGGARIDLFSEFENESESQLEARLHEAYLQYATPDYTFKFGQQIITWGKADEISPLDNLNPEDYRDGFVRRRSERKIPIPMVQAELLGNDERLQLVYIPFYERSQINLYDNDWALFGGTINSIAIQEDHPSNDLDNGEFGFRYAGNFSSFDLAASFLSTRSDLPVFSVSNRQPGAPLLPSNISRGDLAQLANSLGVPLQVDYPTQEVYGLEFETVYNSVGIRGDLAYRTGERSLNNDLSLVDTSTFIATLGLDYTSSSDLYINVQYSPSYIFDYEESFLMSEELQHGFYSEISQEIWRNRLKFGVRSLFGAPLDQYYYNPYLILSYWDSITFEFGGDLIGGDDNSAVGFYEENDQVYFLTRMFL